MFKGKELIFFFWGGGPCCSFKLISALLKHCQSILNSSHIPVLSAMHLGKLLWQVHIYGSILVIIWNKVCANFVEYLEHFYGIVLSCCCNLTNQHNVTICLLLLNFWELYAWSSESIIKEAQSLEHRLLFCCSYMK